MKMLNENDFLYAIDSDVISHNYEGDWQWNNEDIYDLIFFERFGMEKLLRVKFIYSEKATKGPAALNDTRESPGCFSQIINFES